MLLFWSSLSFYLRIDLCWDKVTAIRMFFLFVCFLHFFNGHVFLLLIQFRILGGLERTAK